MQRLSTAYTVRTTHKLWPGNRASRLAIRRGGGPNGARVAPSAPRKGTVDLSNESADRLTVQPTDTGTASVDYVIVVCLVVGCIGAFATLGGTLEVNVASAACRVAHLLDHKQCDEPKDRESFPPPASPGRRADGTGDSETTFRELALDLYAASHGVEAASISSAVRDAFDETVYYGPAGSEPPGAACYASGDGNQVVCVPSDSRLRGTIEALRGTAESDWDNLLIRVNGDPTETAPKPIPPSGRPTPLTLDDWQGLPGAAADWIAEWLERHGLYDPNGSSQSASRDGSRTVTPPRRVYDLSARVERTLFGLSRDHMAAGLTYESYESAAAKLLARTWPSNNLTDEKQVRRVFISLFSVEAGGAAPPHTRPNSGLLITVNDPDTLWVAAPRRSVTRVGHTVPRSPVTLRNGFFEVVVDSESVVAQRGLDPDTSIAFVPVPLAKLPQDVRSDLVEAAWPLSDLNQSGVDEGIAIVLDGSRTHPNGWIVSAGDLVEVAIPGLPRAHPLTPSVPALLPSEPPPRGTSDRGGLILKHGFLVPRGLATCVGNDPQPPPTAEYNEVRVFCYTDGEEIVRAAELLLGLESNPAQQ